MATQRPLEGEALERTSFSSLFSKEWNATFWSLQGNLLLLYPNKELYIRNPTQGRKTIKLKADMHITEVVEKAYKGYGSLFKFAVFEEIDHGKSVVARFAAFKEEDARFFAEAVAAALKQVRADAGIEEEEDVVEEEEEAAPAPARNHGMWGGLDG